uniref:LBD37 n=2 Tax=Arundo donax TaxID=35708 RepID=A0A0A8XTE0_ARUDO
MVRPAASYSSDWNNAGRCASGTAEMKERRPARPKNLATKTVAWPCASAASIHWRQGRSTQPSLQPLRSTRQPLQLITTSIHTTH